MVEHEARDIAPRPILCTMAALAVLIVASAIGLDLIYGGTPRPARQVTPPTDLVAYRAAKAAEYSTYGWVDRDGGIARVPVPEAMRLIAERGLPETPSCGPVPRAPECGAKR